MGRAWDKTPFVSQKPSQRSGTFPESSRPPNSILEKLGSGTRPCAPPAGGNLGIHPSVIEQWMNLFLTQIFQLGPAATVSGFFFAAVASLKLGPGLLSERGFCSFLAPGEVWKIPQHFREKTFCFLFSVLIARAGGNKKAALSDLPIFRSY